MAADTQQEFDDVDYVDVGLSIVDTGGGRFRTDGRPPKISTAIETGILVRYGLVDTIHGKLTSEDDKFCSIFVFDFQFNRLRPSRFIYQVNIDVLVTAEPHAEVSFVTPEERVSINPSTQDVEWVVGAVVGHNVALIRKLVVISKGLVSAMDHHGWTPLHWAMRNAYRPGPGGGWNSLEVVREDLSQTVEILLGSDPHGLAKIGYASDRAWTPTKLAKYHGVYDMVKDKLAMQTDKADDDNNRAEYSRLYESPVAVKHPRFCDACFCQIRGVYYSCSGKTCFGDFDLCFKCIEYEHEQGFHEETHTLLKEGPEYEDAAAAAAVEAPEIVVTPATFEREVSLEPSRVEEIHSWDDFIDFDDLSVSQTSG